jgi:glutathione S-transferase
MYTLYYSPGAASWVLHWLLIELDLPYEPRRLDLAAGEQKRPEYLALNPLGVVPTLLIDGSPLWETGGLLLHLADARPDAQLAPALGSVERARYYQWIVHLANHLQPLFRRWFYAQEVAGEEAVDRVKASTRAAIEATFERIDQHLALHGPFLLGERITAADYFLTMLMRWSRNMPRPATDWPQLQALASRMKARPSFAVLNEREGLTEWL